MANLSTDWPFWLAATLLGSLSLFILYRAMFRDRSRGRRRCPKCWYDMSGADASREKGLVCPECGRDAKRERRLYKTRKRWGLAGAACAIGAAAWLAARTPEARRHGPSKFAPTTLLILALPALEPTPNIPFVTGVKLSLPRAAYADLAGRVRSDRLWSWQRSLLWSRVEARAEHAAREGDFRKKSELYGLMFSLRRVDPALNRRFIGIAAKRLIVLPAQSPSHLPLTYTIDSAAARDIGALSCAIVVEPLVEGAEPIEIEFNENLRTASLATDARAAFERFPIGSFPDGERQIRFAVRVYETRGRNILNDRLVWSGQLVGKTHIGGPPTLSISPFSGMAKEMHPRAELSVESGGHRR